MAKKLIVLALALIFAGGAYWVSTRAPGSQPEAAWLVVDRDVGLRFRQGQVDGVRLGRNRQLQVLWSDRVQPPDPSTVQRRGERVAFEARVLPETPDRQRDLVVVDREGIRARWPITQDAATWFLIDDDVIMLERDVLTSLSVEHGTVERIETGGLLPQRIVHADASTVVVLGDSSFAPIVWAGEHAALGPQQQGAFLGAAAGSLYALESGTVVRVGATGEHQRLAFDASRWRQDNDCPCLVGSIDDTVLFLHANAATEYYQHAQGTWMRAPEHFITWASGTDSIQSASFSCDATHSHRTSVVHGVNDIGPGRSVARTVIVGRHQLTMLEHHTFRTPHYFPFEGGFYLLLHKEMSEGGSTRADGVRGQDLLVRFDDGGEPTGSFLVPPFVYVTASNLSANGVWLSLPNGVVSLNNSLEPAGGTGTLPERQDAASELERRLRVERRPR